MGWFENTDDGRRRLLNIKIDNTDQLSQEGRPIQSAALYTLVATMGEVLPIDVAVETMLSRFDELHLASKDAVGSVLTPVMQNRISLFV